jgi:hypothetical protein
MPCLLAERQDGDNQDAIQKSHRSKRFSLYGSGNLHGFYRIVRSESTYTQLPHLLSYLSDGHLPGYTQPPYDPRPCVQLSYAVKDTKRDAYLTFSHTVMYYYYMQAWCVPYVQYAYICGLRGRWLVHVSPHACISSVLYVLGVARDTRDYMDDTY